MKMLKKGNVYYAVLFYNMAMYNGLSTVECKNSLATKYRQSQLCQNVLEELGHVDQHIAEGAKGHDKAAEYATSFFYQVSQLQKHIKTLEKTCFLHKKTI